MGEAGEGQLIIGRKPALELILAEPERVDVVFVREGRERGSWARSSTPAGGRERGSLAPDRELDRLCRAHRG